MGKEVNLAEKQFYDTLVEVRELIIEETQILRNKKWASYNLGMTITRVLDLVDAALEKLKSGGNYKTRKRIIPCP